MFQTGIFPFLESPRFIKNNKKLKHSKKLRDFPINKKKNMEKYKIQKTIGSGSFANVSKALNTQTSEIVAIKKMKKKFFSWDECLSLREIKSLTKLNHPNIMKLKEVIRVNDELFCVFEFCDQNIYQYYLSFKESGQQIPESQIKQILYQIVSGLAYMHKHGFFHRDLKPENILYSKGVIKIGDFGLAREIRSRPPYTDYVATRWYRAPEILLKSTNYNSPVDIYALGCIIAELYLLNPLFSGSSELDQMHKICSVLGTPSTNSWSEGYRLASQIGFNFPHYQPIPLNNILQNANPDAIQLIGQMLSFDPGKRPTALQILQHPFLNGIAGLFPYNNLIVISSSIDERKRNKSLDNEKENGRKEVLLKKKSMESDEEELVLVKKDPFEKKKEEKKEKFELWKGENEVDFIVEEKKKLVLLEKKNSEQKIENIQIKPFVIKDKEKGNNAISELDKRIFTLYDEEIFVENEQNLNKSSQEIKNIEEEEVEDEIKLESHPLYNPSLLSKNLKLNPEFSKNIEYIKPNIENLYGNNKNFALENKEKIFNNKIYHSRERKDIEKPAVYEKNPESLNIFLPKLRQNFNNNEENLIKNNKNQISSNLPAFDLGNNLLNSMKPLKNPQNKEKNIMKLPNLGMNGLNSNKNPMMKASNVNMPVLYKNNFSPVKNGKEDEGFIGKYKL